MPEAQEELSLPPWREEPAGLRVLIVAAYASMRAGLHALLAEETDLILAGEVSGSDELARLLPEAAPDVILCDDNPPDRAALLEALARHEAPTVLLADCDALSPLLNAALPAWGCLRREADGEEIASALRAVASGLVTLDRGFAALLSVPTPVALERENREDDGVTPTESLTAREREVLQLMAQGLPNKVIATRLGISLHTVKFHVASILARLGASSRTEAVTLGARRGHILL